MVLTGSKDNSIRVWSYDLDAGFQKKLKCIAVMQGHSQNISGLCFAPKRGSFFTSVS
jgi:WD40 repeat protein